MSKATKINKNQLAKFIDYLENKNRKNDNNTINGCVEFLKTALYTSPSFIYDTTLETHLKTKKFFEEINFDSLSTDHLFNIGSILQQGADIKTFTCFISYFLQEIKKVLSSYPKELICLLSHFPNLYKNLPLSNIH
ncbi:uncharacterized protein LOC126900365 [Daktulosphaira vitifoliae]|uniref:uncharacterized protein LOC126900365 n=1 Tax=Daktulosphaira vitifoliae TaxID=58002 RepID=UPI0021AAEE82|nr:uncharacterized protein LOC126900365 [Daktulosphaira vitifoliae]